MKLKVGDKVKIIAGKEKGKEGMIVRTLRNENRVVVEGINLVKKHTKPSGEDQTGGIVEREAPLHVSNVMLIEPKAKKTGSNANKKDNQKKTTKKSEDKLD
ncbi:MAG: 50S ribosomal protein L24 [Bacilli bacterium]|nr:50S ribosomal protein L24 [Bacilli bacterium]